MRKIVLQKPQKVLLPKHVWNPDPNIYWSDNYLVLDFETTNRDKGDAANRDNFIVTCSWKRGSDTHLERGDTFPSDEFCSAIKRSDFLVCHNAKFEISWLNRLGIIRLPEVLTWCTQIAEYCLAGNRDWTLTLDACMVRRGMEGKEHIVHKLIQSGVCPSEIPYSMLSKYVMTDVLITEKLFLSQRKELRDRLGLVYTKCLTTPILVDVESRGLYLSKERVETIARRTNEELNKLEIEFAVFTGGINARSPKQKAEYIYGELQFDPVVDYKGDERRTDTGLLSTDAITLSLLKPRNKRQEEFLRLIKRILELKNRNSKYFDKFVKCLEEDKGILYANIGQTFTHTHRLQSNGKKHKVQIHNIQRDFKPCFRAREPGWKFAEVDFKALEFRTAVHLGADAQGLKDIEENHDPHRLSASIIFAGSRWDKAAGGDKELYDTLRTSAKSHTFKPLYGGTSGTKKEREYYAAFRKRYPGIVEVQEQWKQEALSQKTVTTPTGLLFYFPTTQMTSNGYIKNTTAICNYPVQYLATGEIVPIALIYQWHLMQASEMKSFIVNTIHDSTETEVAPGEEEIFVDISKKSFIMAVPWYLKKVYGIDLLVPMGVEIKIEEFWNDRKEWQEKWLKP